MSNPISNTGFPWIPLYKRPCLHLAGTKKTECSKKNFLGAMRILCRAVENPVFKMDDTFFLLWLSKTDVLKKVLTFLDVYLTTAEYTKRARNVLSKEKSIENDWCYLFTGTVYHAYASCGRFTGPCLKTGSSP